MRAETWAQRGSWWLIGSRATSRAGCFILDRYALVAQGIEHFSPKEGVGRSNRLGGTQNWHACRYEKTARRLQ